MATKPEQKPLEIRRAFWVWFLTNAVFNLVDIENMAPEMETSFKMNVLILGRGIFFNDNDDKLRILGFADGGKVPVYPGQIERFLIVNPVIGEYTFDADQIGTECVPIYLTMLDRCQLASGFSKLINAYAADLADNDLTIEMVQFLKRLPVVFKAKTDNDLRAIVTMLDAIRNGDKTIAAQTTINGMLERMDAGTGTNTPLSEFTEYQQYKIGQFYAMLGVNTVWNMKRENVAAAENATNGETARYNISDIIDGLNDQLEIVNTTFNTLFKARLNVERAAEITKRVENDVETPIEPETEQEGADNDGT